MLQVGNSVPKTLSFNSVDYGSKCVSLIQYLGTVSSERLASSTTSTARFPTTAAATTNHTLARSHVQPITSSHGFSASGRGVQFTTRNLKQSHFIEFRRFTANANIKAAQG